MNTNITNWIGTKNVSPGKTTSTNSLGENATSTKNQAFLGLIASFLGKSEKAGADTALKEASGDETSQKKQDSKKSDKKDAKAEVTAAAAAEIPLKNPKPTQSDGDKKALKPEKAGKQSKKQAKTNPRQQKAKHNKAAAKEQLELVDKNTAQELKNTQENKKHVSSLSADDKKTKLAKPANRQEKNDDNVSSTTKKKRNLLKTSAFLKQKFSLKDQSTKSGTDKNEVLKKISDAQNGEKANSSESAKSLDLKAASKKGITWKGIDKSAHSFTKELLKKENTQSGGSQAGSKSQKDASFRLIKPSSNENLHAGELLSSKKNMFFSLKSSSPGKATPGNMLLKQSPGSANMKSGNGDSGQFKKNDGNPFQEVQANNLNSAHLAETAGRKTFARQLVQKISQQQVRQQSNNSKQTSAWKHQRFVLKDGNSIHIAARSSDGALQLQLNAGSGKLGKLLHNHLQELQQHVQQELNVEINLQLTGQKGGMNQDQHRDNSPSNHPQNQTLKSTGEAVKDISYTTTNHVRYFGFNQNEWTA